MADVQMVDGLAPWTVVARNMPEHAGNVIHTDAGARAAGFPRALVAGVTTYAYLTHPVVAGWGVDWLAGGGGEVRLRHPVFEHDEVHCEPVADGDRVVVQARTGDGADQPRALLRPVRRGGPPPPSRPGDALTAWDVTLDGRWGVGHGDRLGDDLQVYVAGGLVHPAVWPSLANQVVHAQVARGAWIHTRSIIRHHRSVTVGSRAKVESVIVQRFVRHGERAVLDVRVTVDGEIVATLEHEAIVALP